MRLPILKSSTPTPDAVFAAAPQKRVCTTTRQGFGSLTFVCQTCEIYKRRRVCSDPSDPSTCFFLYELVDTDTNCVTVPSWVFA